MGGDLNFVKVSQSIRDATSIDSMDIKRQNLRLLIINQIESMGYRHLYVICLIFE